VSAVESVLSPIVQLGRQPLLRDTRYLLEIENGRKDPSLTVLKTFADGFKLSLAQFLRFLVEYDLICMN
jgi:hypothetical protein